MGAGKQSQGRCWVSGTARGGIRVGSDDRCREAESRAAMATAEERAMMALR
jgi:hypothetical protein